MKSSAKIGETVHQNLIDLPLLRRKLWVSAEVGLWLTNIKVTIQPQKK